MNRCSDRNVQICIGRKIRFRALYQQVFLKRNINLINIIKENNSVLRRRQKDSIDKLNSPQFSKTDLCRQQQVSIIFLISISSPHMLFSVTFLFFTGTNEPILFFLVLSGHVLPFILHFVFDFFLFFLHLVSLRHNHIYAPSTVLV